jgi:choice-of-anchor C domain-containing protein
MKKFNRVWVAAALVASGAAHANLILNGSFESASVNPATYQTLAAGSTAITNWVVGAPNVDYINKGEWNASDGNRSVDLDGGVGSAGSVSQSFATLAGADYRVTFDLSGNPGALPMVKTVRVSAGADSANFDYTIGTNHLNNSGALPWVLTYEAHTFEFTATGAQTTLTFASLTGQSGSRSGWGPVIDNVDVELLESTPPTPAIPEPSTVALMAVGLAAVGFTRRRKSR